MTEHSPDQEPRLLEGSSADPKSVTIEAVGGTVASGNVAYATERIENSAGMRPAPWIVVRTCARSPRCVAAAEGGGRIRFLISS